MKVGTVLAVVLLAAVAIAGTYWVARSDSGGPTEAAAAKPAGPAESTEPTPSKTGPHPKVVLPEAVFDFGVMPVGETRKHVFVVRNEGEAPLRLGKPTTTCQCTVSESAQNQIPPGGEGTITLEWSPAGATPTFDKGAVLKTNDPKKPEIQLSVVGIVDEWIRVEPQGTWNVGEVDRDVPANLSGYLFSRLLDTFAIESITTTNPLLTVEAEPASPETIKEYEAKCGYRLKAKLAPGMPAGRISEKVVVKTDVKDEDFDEITFEFVGMRPGPIQILPLPGTKWEPDAWAVDLERFPAAKGKSAAVSLFVSGLPEGQELKFESVKTSEPYVAVELKRDEASKSEKRQRYVLTFSVPPGSPVATHRSKGSVKVEATTNHPEASAMKFYVQFISTP
jgi:hypothetical protein